MNIEQCKETYEMLKKHKELVANIDKDFFLNFAELLFNKLETSRKETQEVLNDYQDLGKELHKLECEAEKKDKVINEIEDLCIRKSDDEGEEYGGVIIWNFAHKIMEIINKVEREGK